MTTVQKRLLAVLAVLVVVGGAWKLLLEPAVQDRSAAQEELATAQTAEATAQTALQAARVAEREVPANQRALRAFARVVPDQPESSALLDRLDALARRSGVRFDSLQLAGADGTGAAAAAPAAPAATGDAAAATGDGAAGGSSGGAAQEIPVTLKLSGTYPRVVSLLRRLHGRGATLGGGRLLKLSQVKIAEETEESSAGRLAVDVTAVAFVLPRAGAAEGAAAPTTPTEGAADTGAATATAPGGTG